jgi:hypothetical protein
MLALAIFDNRVLGRSVQGTHYRFVWDGTRVSKIYEFSDGREILREELLAEYESQQAA